ncbi:MAG: hypothetical protein Q9160_008689 [Pyrenula sp. 1 TL-2023]
MSAADNAARKTAPMFPSKAPVTDAILSSSPGFGTPQHPIIPINANGKFKPPAPPKASVLPILLPPATLRPVAFRTVTKKHNLTLTSSALQQLATFVGKHCGSGWREEGLAEKVLDEVAKQWKRNGGGIILEDGQKKALTSILQGLEGNMSGGRIVQLKRASSFADSAVSLSRQNSLEFPRPGLPSREDSQASLGLSTLNVSEDDEDDTLSKQTARSYLNVVSAYDQPRLEHNSSKKFFEQNSTAPSLFPPPSHKTAIFRSRYNLVHQRLLRNESFQTPTFAPTSRTSLQRSDSTLATASSSYKITQIANLLGRSGSSHLILGLLVRAPTGDLALADLTGSITLDLHHARPVPEDGVWFCPGMIVLVDGIYEEEGGSSVGNSGGVGGMIGGRFIGVSIGGPPCERREVTLGTSNNARGDKMPASINAGFGWVDFLGTGSEKAQGEQMRRIQGRLLGRHQRNRLGDSDFDTTPLDPRTKIVIFADLHLDNPRVLASFRMTLSSYSRGPSYALPLALILMGNFTSHAAMAGSSSGGSIEYKERFDALASVLGEFPTLLASTTLIFVPGDNDPWASAFSAGAATPIPREGVPELFTSRIKRAMAAANAEAKSVGPEKGEVVWTSNPARMSVFGPLGEMVLFRDDISARLRRSGIVFQPGGEEEEDTEEGDVGDAAMREGHEPSQTTESAESQPPPPSEEMELDPSVLNAESHQPPPPLAPNPSPDTNQHYISSSRKLVKTILDQSHLSPFPLSTRPILWDYAHTLSLYPLPSVLVLADGEAEAFAVTYEGCLVVNPGSYVAGRGGGGGGRLKGEVRWVEVDVGRGGGRWKGEVRRERY